MTATTPTSEIRTWARAQGMAVGNRGRLSPQILTAHAASRNPSQPPSARTAQPAGIIEGGPGARVIARPVPGATGITRTISARVR